MSLHNNMHRFVGMAIAAATLLALAAPMGSANAAGSTAPADTSAPITVPITGTETITVKLGDTSKGEEANAQNMKNHSFKALRIGTYENAAGVADTKTLSSVAVGTDAGVMADAQAALKAVTGTAPDAAYVGNPVGEVASKWLGYDSASNASNQDKTSNSGSAGNAWGSNGKLRQFVTALAKQNGFKTSVTGSSAASASANDAGTEAQFTGLKPGIYVVEDVTEASAAAPDTKNAIPMLVGTAITSGSVTYNQIDGQTLGEIVMKNDDQPTVGKKLDTTKDNDPSIGGIMHYVLTSKVPLTTGYGHYIFTMIDRPAQDGLTYVDGSAAITVGNYKMQPTDFTVKPVASKDGVSTSYVVFDLSPSIRARQYQSAITVTYQMRVNDNAQGGALKNSVSLNYSNDINDQSASDSANVALDDKGNPVVTNGGSNGGVISTKSDPSSSVASYFRSFDLVKRSKASNEGLAGAQFQVKDSTGTAIEFRKLADGSYKKAAIQNTKDSHYTDDPDYATNVLSVSGSEGRLKVDGLKDGTYTVVETTAPAGYSDAFKPSFKVTVGGGATDETAGTSMVANTSDVWNLVASHDTALADSAANAIVVLNVNSMSQLPLTGGAGIILALLVIVLLMVATATLIFVRRRLRAE